MCICGIEIISTFQVQEIEKQYEKLDKHLKKLQGAHEETKAVTKAPAMKCNTNTVRVLRLRNKFLIQHEMKFGFFMFFFVL